MKKAFRYLGIGFFLSALLLFVVFKMNIDFINRFVNNNTATVTSTSTTTASTSTTSKPVAMSTQSSATQTTTAATTETTTTTTSTSKGSIIEVVVDQSDVSYTVAQKLVDAGILSQTSEFNKYMEENNLARYIQTGKFKIPSGVTLQELGKILTTYPGN